MVEASEESERPDAGAEESPEQRARRAIRHSEQLAERASQAALETAGIEDEIADAPAGPLHPERDRERAEHARAFAAKERSEAQRLHAIAEQARQRRTED
jgi:hypothetical protein